MIVMIGTMCQSIFRHSRLSSSAVSTGGGVIGTSPLNDMTCDGSDGGLTSSTLKSISKSFSDDGHPSRLREILMAGLRLSRKLTSVLAAWGALELVIGRGFNLYTRT